MATLITLMSLTVSFALASRVTAVAKRRPMEAANMTHIEGTGLGYRRGRPAAVRVLGALSALGVVTTMFVAPVAAAAAVPVDLGAAAEFSVLGGSAVTNTGLSVLNRAVGVSPGTSVTGFPPGLVEPVPADGMSIRSNDSTAQQAQADLHLAYEAIGLKPAHQQLPASIDGGTPIHPGVHHRAGALAVAGTVRLDAGGDPNAVFIFRTESTLTTASNTSIELVNGADACNVFWQVGSSATLGAGTAFTGSLLAAASITATAGTSVEGRLFALDGAATFDTTAITTEDCAEAAATVSLTASSSAGLFGDPVTLTAALGQVDATGTVTFASTSAAGVPVTLGTATVANGVAVLTGHLPAFGPNAVTASYSGDESYGGATSEPRSVEVSAYAGQVIISEFRGSGPAGDADSYLEIYNTGRPAPLAGFTVTTSAAAFALPESAPVLGTNRTYLIAGASYSLGVTAGHDLTAAVGSGAAELRAPDTARTVTDAAGPAGSAHLGTALRAIAGSPNEHHAWVRNQLAGRPVDSRNNAADFQFVSTTGGLIGGLQSTLGSPSPTGTRSPFQHNATLKSFLLDAGSGSSAAPNRSYVAGSPATLVIRRTITNTSGSPVAVAKVRVTALSAVNGAPNAGALTQPARKASLRAVNPDSATSVVPLAAGGQVVVQNLSVDAPVTGAPGGGLNSTFTVPLGAGLAEGASVNVSFTFEVDTGGSFWFGYDLEALTVN